MTRNQICILMSTYNGEKFLREQLDSIIQQDEVDIRILIRDDGSSDSTIDIIREYQGQYNFIELITGENKGAKQSFIELIEIAKTNPTYNYYAFADQDDVWMKDKLTSAIWMLESNKADFYYSAFSLVNQQLQPINTPPIHPIYKFGAALVFNAVTGCTVVFRQSVLKLLTVSPTDIIMHDSWLFKVALGCGLKVICDKTSHILYRQHDHNVFGSNDSHLKTAKKRMIRFRQKNCDRYKEAMEVLHIYRNQLTSHNLKTLQLLEDYHNKNIIKRMGIAIRPVFRTGRAINTLLFIISIITKRY